jgi:hypothetical protein
MGMRCRLLSRDDPFGPTLVHGSAVRKPTAIRMIALHCLRHVRTLVEQNTGVEPMTRAKLGVSRSVINDDPWEWSLHGLRHPPAADTNGWYLWTGELQADPDFFLPSHASHLVDRCPDLGRLLSLPPGSRFMYAPDYLDVWDDPSLLKP